MSSGTIHSDVNGDADTEKDAVAFNTLPPTNSDSFQIFLDAPEDPQNMSAFKKWAVIIVISFGALCATCSSAVSSFTNPQVMARFNISQIVAILPVSLFSMGLALGPLLVGPLSELYGRNIVYRVSYGTLFAFSWPVAFAPNTAVYLFFRFVTGFCSSAFLTVIGGTAGDMFSNKQVGDAMALVTIVMFSGPVLAPLMSGFINQHLNWRWTYHIMTIWAFTEFVLLLLFVPETYAPILLKRKVSRLRKSTGNSAYWSASEEVETSVLRAIAISCYTPFKLLLLDQMALLLSIWTALLLGILYLALEAFPIIFGRHGFDMQQTGLTFLGIGLGQTLAFLTQPLWTKALIRISEKHDGKPPAEVHLYMGQLGGILVPLSLYWLAFTTYQSVHWIVPIIASVPLGSGIYFVFKSVFTYLVIAYRPVAASAMSANNAMRSAFAAGFPLFAGAMYVKLGTVGATALLAGLTTVMAPLPFVFHRYGESLRRNSPFAAA